MTAAVGGSCSLYIDIGLDAAVAPGDWVATEAGARCYLVTASAKVRSRIHAQRNRFRLRCDRLPRDVAPPDDVVVWWLRWYPRDRRRP